LTNVIRHSGAAHVEVEITREAGDLRVRVADDGTGLTESDESGRVRLGLVGMRERVQALGGDFRAISTPGAGFGVAATIPVPAQPPAGIRNDPSGVEANGVAR